MALTLPKSPSGEQYEDLVAACLRALGYFVETRLTLREVSKEVLEVDAVATPSGGSVADRILVEAKKDGISFGNVFKLYGQRMYLGIGKACLVSLKVPDKAILDLYSSKGAEVGVKICNLGVTPEDILRLADPKNGLSDIQRLRVVAAGWYLQIARRVASAAFLHECKSHPDVDLLARARTYFFNVRASFFQPTPLARAEALYNAYLASPRLAGEMLTKAVDGKGVDIKDAWKKVADDAQWPWIQALMDTESSARFAIIKNAFDDFVTRGSAPPPEEEIQFGGLSLRLPLHALPRSFVSGMEKLRGHAHFSRLPYLFQSFYDVLGGFLAFKDEEELAFLEALTNIPKADLVSSLQLIDEFFSSDGKSMLYRQQDEILCLKMVPGFVHGCGAFLRQSLFGLKDYSTRYAKMGWLLGRWHQAGYRMLEAYLEKRSAETAA